MGIIQNEKLEELKELSGGNNDLLIDLLDKYITNAAKYIAEARSGLEAGDVQKVQFAVHTMKGSSLSLGLSQLGEILTDLNSRAKNGDIEGFSEKIDTIEKLVVEVEHYHKELAG